jgi:spermidine/putrescine transport system ATP-binding protein
MPEQPPAGTRGAVDIAGVTKRFGATTAVDDLSLAIGAGEFWSLLGPSGCGKTTTLRMLAGFEQPDVGSIRISGTEVAGVAPYARDVNTVFQHYALFPHLSVWDNVAFGPRSRKGDRRWGDAEVRRKVDRVLEIVQLGHLAQRRPAQLSGGQQQRVALARALVNEPSALLLDEPLGALDLKLRQAMQLELKRIHAEVGTTFILVTHDQEEALTMSDRIVVMNAGRAEQVGSPEEIYDRPSTAFVAGFIGQANLWPAQFVAADSATSGTVSVAGTPVAVGADPGVLRAGAALTVMVRPERVRLSAVAPGPGHGGVPATVRDLVFQGPVVRCGLVLADGTDAVAHVPTADPDRPGAPGAAVWLVWPEGSVRALPGGSGEAAGAGRAEAVADPSPSSEPPPLLTPLRP